VTAERLNPSGLAPPAGFSHAVVATGSRIVFLAGQTALDAGGEITGDTLPEQFAKALDNLLAALRAAGGTPADLARVTVYATDVAAYRAQAASWDASGGGWRGGTTRPWRSYRSCACGTSGRWWSSTGSPSWPERRCGRHLPVFRQAGRRGGVLPAADADSPPKG
jgi:enamine deaminase RidA (YjgF/YER057c/UK114 family)